MYKKVKQTWIKHLDFTICDLIFLALAYYLACFQRFGFHIPVFRQQMILQFCLTLLLIYFCVAMFNEAYKNILRRNRWQELKSVVIQVSVTFCIFLIYMYAIKQAYLFSRFVFFPAAIGSAVLIYAMRIVWKRIVRLHMLNNENLPHMLIIADRDTAASCIRTIRKRRYNEFFVSGIVVMDQNMKGESIEDVPIVCNPDEIRCYILSEVIDEVFISMPESTSKKQLVNYLLEIGTTVHLSLLANETDLPNKMIEKMGGHIVLSTSNNVATSWQLFFKRLLDILGGIVGITITGIVFIFIAPQIYKKDPGPIFFSQERVGKNGRKFKIYKFRSMYQNAEEMKKELMCKNQMCGHMFKLDDDPRILPGIGHRIRDWSLDELPQFWNILKGDMSLVGTRPPTVDEFSKYDAHHKMRLSFKPGLTGMWQVSGRSNIKDFEQIVRLDNHYIKDWNLRLDIKILFKTFGVVFCKKGSM